MTDAAAPQVSRKTLIALILVFVGPLALAIVLFAFRDRLPIPGPRTVGELIVPAVPVPDLHPRSLAAAPLTESIPRGRWTLAYLTAGGCDLQCEANLFKMRQVRLLVGRDRDRVDRLLLITGPTRPGGLDEIIKRYPKLPIGELNAADQHALVQVLSAELPDHVFIVDPLGNAMMRYPTDVTAKGLLKDLKHLLKVSQIG